MTGMLAILLAASSPRAWSPDDKYSLLTLSNANIRATGSGSNGERVRAVTPRSTGQYYFEETWVSGAADTLNIFPFFGFEFPALAPAIETRVGAGTAGLVGVNYDGTVYRGGSLLATLPSALSIGETVGFEVDRPNDLFRIRRTGYLSSNFSLGGLTGDAKPSCSSSNSPSVIDLRVISTSFVHTPTGGFGEWT